MEYLGRRGRRFGRSRVTAAALARRAVAGIVPGDHVCTSYGSDEEHRAIVGRYARQALRRGERFLYLAHASDDATIRAYLEHEGIDVAAGEALGQIQILRATRSRALIDPEAIVASLQAQRRAALHDGYSALCVASEMSWARPRSGEIDAIVRCEHAVDRVFATGDVAAICQYDRRLFEPGVLSPLLAAHEFQLRTGERLTTTERRRLTISESADGVISLAGALDIDASGYLAARLAELDDEGDLVLVTSGLRFADFAGCRALVRAADAFDEGRRMILRDPPEPLVRVLGLCGWPSGDRLVLA